MLRATMIGLAAVAVAAFAGVLGSAGAQNAPGAPAASRTLTATGTGATTIATTAAQADRDSAYRGVLGSALDDAKAKAAFLAGKAGVQLGAVQSVSELSSSPDRFCGGFAVGAANRVASAPLARRVPRRRKTVAKGAQATEGRCYIPAAVSVSYAISG